MPEFLQRFLTKPTEIDERKEAAAGSPLLGRKNWRLTAPKKAALALAFVAALGVSYGLVKRHEAQIEAKHQIILAQEEAEQRNRLGALKRVGVQKPEQWMEFVKINEQVAKAYPTIVEKLTPGDFAQLAKFISSTRKPGNVHVDYYPGEPLDVQAIMPMLKAINPYADSEKDFEDERESLEHAFQYVVIGDDQWMARDKNAVLRYVLENNGRPAFRTVLLKLRRYSMANVYPFDVPKKPPESGSAAQKTWNKFIKYFPRGQGQRP